MSHPVYPYGLYEKQSMLEFPVKESYVNYSDYSQFDRIVEPNTILWIDYFWRAVHIFARTYEPVDDSIKRSYICFYKSMIGILPSMDMRQIIQNFITMTNEVRNVLLENKELSSFFLVHKTIHYELSQNPDRFFINSLKDSDSLFAWSYLLHSYYNIIARIPIESFNATKSMYDKTQISKESWANPIWAIIHFCTLYAPYKIDKNFNTCYKAFLSCLRYCLPCPKCRKHLEDNLSALDIDNYMLTNESLFDYSVKLHNMVNKQLGKPIISIEDAKKIYDPYRQPSIQQNAKFSYRY